MKKVEKVMIIGVDAACPELVQRFISEGKLCNIANLAKRGAFATNCLVPFPTLTPPNWTSIVTGAWPGTHGITDFTVHHPGDSLETLYSGFNSRECCAEYLWDAAERLGKRSILVKYPGSWPPTLKKGIQIDGCHTHECIHELEVEHLFSTDNYPMSTQTNIQPASGWKNLPETNSVPLETSISFAAIEKRTIMGRVLKDEYSTKKSTYHILILDTRGEGYDKIIMSKSKNVDEQVTQLSVGRWSRWIFEKFFKNGKFVKGVFRAKLIELSKDAQHFRLYTTQIMPVKGFTFPDVIGPEIVEKVGPFMTNPGWYGITRSWIDDTTFLELIEQQNNMLADVGNFLMEKYPWDFYFTQTHTIDCAAHVYLNQADPLTSEGNQEYYLRLLGEVYESVDRMIGKLLKRKNDNTLVVVVSDHGTTASASNTRLSVKKILKEAGLLDYKRDEKSGQESINWSKTRAIPQRSVYIYVNLRGRDPEGIVNRGSEYEEVREKIIEVLYDYRDPTTGKNPFVLVLRREDAQILRLQGDKIGDIVYALKPGFEHIHGKQLPTAEYGIGSMKGLLIITGPEIKTSYTLKNPVSLVDIAPTLTYLIDMPSLRNSEGRIIHEILTKPEAKLEEKRKLAIELDRWKKAYERQISMTHYE